MVLAATRLDVAGSTALLREIRASAEAAGMREPTTGAYTIRAILLAPLLAGFLFVAWTVVDAGPALVIAAVAGVLCVQLGFIAHDAGHGAVARGKLGNAIAGQLCFTVLNGLGFQSWRVSHNAHHANCQDESRDPDMSDAVVSLTPRSAEAKTGLVGRLIPYQAVYIWPLALLFAHSLRTQSVWKSYGQPTRYAIDILFLPLHYALWVGLPIVLGAGLGRALAVYFVTSAVMGLYLAVVFWVNHIGMPAFETGHGLTYIEQQVVGTRNVRNPAIFDWFFGGLNFQIEHHLVPDCPGSRLRKLQAITRPSCALSELPYREESFGQALASITRHVHQIAREYKR
jgi:fatty acid desaturase